MVTYRFSLEDLAKTRFAISPSSELVASLRLLRDPAAGALHLPWLSRVARALEGLELGSLLALVRAEGYVPDYFTPPPDSPLAEIGDDLEKIRVTPARQIRHDLDVVLRRTDADARVVRALIERPRGGNRRLAAVMEEYWDRAIAPDWPRIRGFLESDIHYRARRLTEGGPAALFADLHPRITWHGDRLVSHQAWEEEVDLAGRGLLLVPSAFSWQRPVTITSPPWQPTLIYPARGIGTLWEESLGGGTAAVAAVIGRTRADVLAACDAPRSTTELARQLGATPGGISQHLGALRAAGLVTAERHGRSVLYARTRLADELVSGGTLGAREEH